MQPIMGFARRRGVGVEASVRVSRGQLRVSTGEGHAWMWPLEQIEVIDKGFDLELVLGDRIVEFTPSEPRRFRREVVTAVAAARCMALIRPAGELPPEGIVARCDAGHEWREVDLADDVPRRVCRNCGHLVIDLSS